MTTETTTTPATLPLVLRVTTGDYTEKGCGRACDWDRYQLHAGEYPIEFRDRYGRPTTADATGYDHSPDRAVAHVTVTHLDRYVQGLRPQALTHPGDETTLTVRLYAYLAVPGHRALYQDHSTPLAVVAVAPAATEVAYLVRFDDGAGQFTSRIMTGPEYGKYLEQAYYSDDRPDHAVYALLGESAPVLVEHRVHSTGFQDGDYSTTTVELCRVEHTVEGEVLGEKVGEVHYTIDGRA